MNTNDATFSNRVNVTGSEINGAVIARIRTAVAYECSTDEIVDMIGATSTCPTRWVAFMAEAIRSGRA